MNPRERNLAIVVFGMLGVMGAWYAWSYITSGIDSREKEIDKLVDQLDDRQKKLAKAKQSENRLKSYKNRALPDDIELSRSLYQTWLLDHLEKRGMRDVNVTALGSRARNDAIHLHTFNIGCTGNLAQLTRLLHDFYSVDTLHRVRRVSVVPLKDSKDLDLGMTIEALSVKGADHTDKLFNGPSERLTLGDVTKYEESIVGRNLFAPANRPPKLATTSTQRGNPSRSLRFTVKAEDPDKLDTVTYRLAEGAPAGATIDAKSGEFSWTPKTKGEFTVTVIATDDGLPARSSPQKVTISVTDPPPPPVAADPPKKKLDFDNAKFTFVTAIVDAGGRLEAWLTIRTTGQVLKLHEGDKVNIGSIEGKLEKIDSGLIEIATPEKRLVVFLGDNLLQNRPGGL